MNRLCIAVGLLLALTNVGRAAPFVAYTNTDASTGGAGGEIDIGRQFVVTSPIFVSELGVYNDAATNPTGLSNSHVVELLSLDHTGSGATATPVAGGEVTVPAGNTATLIQGFRYQSLAAPITLLPGDYAVIAYGLNSAGDPYGDQPEPSSTTGRLEGPDAFDAGFDPFQLGGNLLPGAYPNNGDGNNHASASFLFVPAPEPSALVALFGLCGMGLIGLAFRRRRRST